MGGRVPQIPLVGDEGGPELVPPRAVLALFGDDREQEVVVNPNMLRGRIEFDETIPAVDFDTEEWLARVSRLGRR